MRLIVPGCCSDPRAMPYIRLLVIAGVMALYLSMGASIFQAIEAPLERDMEDHIEKTKMEFLNNHPCVSVSDSQSLFACCVRTLIDILLSATVEWVEQLSVGSLAHHTYLVKRQIVKNLLNLLPYTMHHNVAS
ncbi:hypothetical protein RR46_11610 [Papilio xuthus]|uniref:Uncharacterized protein n=1 Tax=Papilio xuthus TaxID=66420 RepID=A0A194PRG0_PAPXU|nr:hypothetical protein RR46_11610 [Papilio xuthus]